MDTQYKIIGGDGIEYGPASLDELQGWIREGRVSGITPVWRSDLSKWSPADRYHELQFDLGQLYSSAATTATATAIAAQNARPAGFWVRLAAHLLDRALLLPVFLMIWFPIADAQGWQRMPPNLPAKIDEASWTDFGDKYTNWVDHSAVVYLPIFMIYEVLLNGAFGATLGKMAIGARIRMANGARISYNRAMLRWWAERLSDLLLGAGYLLIAMRPDKRGLHDLIAGTKVIYER